MIGHITKPNTHEAPSCSFSLPFLNVSFCRSFDFNRFCDPREYKPDEGFTNLLRKMRTLINDMKENVDDVGILRDKMRLLKPKLFESASKRLVAAPSGLGNPAEPSKVVATNGKSAKDPSPQRQGSLGFATDRLPNQIKRSEEMPEKNELIMAVKAKKLDKITELLKMGENPNVRAVDGSGWTPLVRIKFYPEVLCRTAVCISPL